MNSAELFAALVAFTGADRAHFFTDSMYVMRGMRRVQVFHVRAPAIGSLASRLKSNFKRKEANHDLWHEIEDIVRVCGYELKVFKVPSTHALAEVAVTFAHSVTEAVLRLGYFAIDFIENEMLVHPQSGLRCGATLPEFFPREKNMMFDEQHICSRTFNFFHQH